MNNSIDNFRESINKYLATRLLKDELFVHSMTKPNKSLDDCITYIINAVHKSGKIAFTDAEIYSLAVHYYDEDDIEVGKPINCTIVSSAEEPEINVTPKKQSPAQPTNISNYKQQSLF